MPNAADNLPILSVNRKYYTLIPSRFPPIDLFDRLMGLQRDAVVEIEALTNPRLRERERLLNGVNATDASSPHLQNWNHAPFAYPNPEGSWFFDETRPALELADTLQTALAVSVRKRELFLARTGEDPVDLDMRVLSHCVKGKFLDASSWDPNLSKEERWSRGRDILDREVDGVIFRCPHRPSAQCIAILNGQALGRAVQEEHFRFVWDGQRIKTLYAFRDGLVILPERLAMPEAVLAA
jgi:hypothetical protein